MWVLMVFLWGGAAPLTMHDFDGKAACQNAERIVLAATAEHSSQATAYCVEREHALIGTHDDAPPTH